MYLPSKVIDLIVARMQIITKWLTKLANAMNEIIFSMIDETE